jgi:DNA-binding NarL/FixJ family response regulator
MPNGTALRFVIADDHPMVRDALGAALREAFSGCDVAFAGTAGEASALLESTHAVDALLLDLDMPGMDGLTGLATLRAAHPSVPIIVVSAARDRSVIRRALDLGAAGYISKAASLPEIAAAVRAVLDGEIVNPLGEAEPGDTDAADFAGRAAQLTPQQWRVFALMIQGEPNKLIAFKLSVGEATVKAHVTEILRKLGVHSRTQAVILARHLALEPPKP